MRWIFHLSGCFQVLVSSAAYVKTAVKTPLVSPDGAVKSDKRPQVMSGLKTTS